MRIEFISQVATADMTAEEKREYLIDQANKKYEERLKSEKERYMKDLSDKLADLDMMLVRERDEDKKARIEREIARVQTLMTERRNKWPEYWF